jgi:hypothetical protein
MIKKKAQVNLNLEIGVGLTAFGLFFMMMGVMMLFDGGLMAIGNVSHYGL